MANIATRTKTELAELPDAELAELDSIAQQYALIRPEEGHQFTQAIKQAKGIALLRKAMTPEVMDYVMALQGSRLGFRTDKDREGGYPPNVVADCAIEANMRGLAMIGNQFNIIAGGCYVTKEGLIALLDRIPGLRYFFTPGVPKIVPSGAEATIAVTWSLDGKDEKTERLTFPIRVNSGMGADAINGKAEKRAAQWLYKRLTGMELPFGDIDDASSSASPLQAKESMFRKAPRPVEGEVVETPAQQAAEPQPQPQAQAQEGPQTPEEQYPALAALCAKDQRQLRVQDFIDFFAARKWAMDEQGLIANYGKASEMCLSWLQAQANTEFNSVNGGQG